MKRSREKPRRNSTPHIETIVEHNDNRRAPPLIAKNARQKDYIRAISRSEMTISLGPAGTGKTFIAATMACDMLKAGKIEKVVLSRPNVACGQSLGFFPGTLAQKMEPWLMPFLDVMRNRLGAGAFETYVKRGAIEIVPFETLRGRSFNDAFVLLDEGQNTTVGEIKAFATRLGENCTTIINGDISQSDIPGKSGLAALIEIVHDREIEGVEIIEFTLDDIVRSNLCAAFVRAFHEKGL